MKRFIASLAATAILSMPMAVSALEKMNNSQLKSTTGQSGVSIAVDDIVIYQKGLADVTYVDTDGLGAANRAGIMIDYADTMHKLTIIDAITESSGTAAEAPYAAANLAATFGFTDTFDGKIIGIVDGGTAGPGGGNWATLMDPSNGNVSDAVAEFATGISPLTIDVGECASLTAGWLANTGGGNVIAADGTLHLDGSGVVPGFVAGVVIGLPTVEITNYYTTHEKAIKLVQVTAAGNAGINNDKEFITIQQSGNSTMAILGGRLEIAPH